MHGIIINQPTRLSEQVRVCIRHGRSDVNRIKLVSKRAFRPFKKLNFLFNRAMFLFITRHQKVQMVSRVLS